MDINSFLQRLQPYGLWQSTQMCLLFLGNLQGAFHIFSIVFIGYESNYSCISLNNATDSDAIRTNTSEGSIDQCSAINITRNDPTACTRWRFEDDVPTTITIEWSLVCGNRYLVAISQTVLIAGQALGATAFSALSDRFGRKRIILVSETVMLVVSFATAFVTFPWMFIALRFLTGIAQQGIITTVYVLLMELTTIEQRTWVVPGLGGITWSLSLCLLAMIGFLFRHESWRYLQMVLSLSGVVVLILHVLYLDESLRWLLGKCKSCQIFKLLKKIYKRNKIDEKAPKNLADFLEIIRRSEKEGTGFVDISMKDLTVDNLEALISDTEEDNDAVATDDVTTPVNRSTIPEYNEDPIMTPSLILRNPILRKTTLLLFWVWTSCVFVYYGTSLMSTTLAGNRFLNFFLLSIVEAPCSFTAYLCLKWLGRKKTLYTWQIVTALALITSAFLPTSTDEPVPGWVNTSLWMLAKFAVSLVFVVILTYTPELYPTMYRNLGFGIESSAARVGGMIAPFAAHLVDVTPWLPGVVLGACSILACVAIIPFPETVHADLPANLDELNVLWSDTKTKRKTSTERN